MKKVILTLVAVATMGIANAQLFVGADLGFGTTTNKSVQTTNGQTTTYENLEEAPNTTSWTIMPKIGFQVNNKLAVGLVFGVNGNKEVWDEQELAGLDYVTVNYTTKGFGWGVTPFVRYNAFEFGNFALFCELQIPIASTKYNRIEKWPSETRDIDYGKDFNFGVQVVPGLNYKLSDHINFDMYVNLLQLGWNMQKYTYEPDDTHKTESKSSSFDFGVYSLPQAITLGFNYVF